MEYSCVFFIVEFVVLSTWGEQASVLYVSTKKYSEQLVAQTEIVWQICGQALAIHSPGRLPVP